MLLYCTMGIIDCYNGYYKMGIIKCLLFTYHLSTVNSVQPQIFILHRNQSENIPK